MAASDSIELTEQDIVDFIGDDADSELSCFYEALGAKGVLDLVTNYGGSSVYVPNLASLQRIKRDRVIIQEYQEGMSIARLARRYGISTRQIYSIVNGR
ncbi:MAG: Mor transcription activator family protein [Oscillospiraceae bacterium]